MDDLDSAKPVVTNKPIRGRQLMTKIVPTDMFEALRSKKPLGPDEKEKELSKGVVYHEGYIDRRLYLVPDSTLEAMKESVNIKMRRRNSIRYKDQTSFEISDYDYLKWKVKALTEKLESFTTLSADDKEKVKEKRKDAMTETDVQKAKTKVLHKREEETAIRFSDLYDDRNESLMKEDNLAKHRQLSVEFDIMSSDERSKLLDEQLNTHSRTSFKLSKPFVKHTLNGQGKHLHTTPSFKHAKPCTGSIERIAETSEIKAPTEIEFCYRFLISGHFIGNKTPMYIIQEYNGPKLLSGEEDLSSSKTDKEVDIFINGRFFTKNILEECKGDPLAFIIAKRRIFIDKTKCEVYKDNFRKLYKYNAADVHVKGEFIKYKQSTVLTPFLSLKVTRHLLDRTVKPSEVGVKRI